MKDKMQGMASRFITLVIGLLSLTGIITAQDTLDLRSVVSSHGNFRVQVPADWDTHFFEADDTLISRSDDVLMALYFTGALDVKGYTTVIPEELNQIYATNNGFVNLRAEILESNTSFRYALYHDAGIIFAHPFGEADMLLIDVRTDDVDGVLDTVLAMLDTVEVYTPDNRIENYDADWRTIVIELQNKSLIPSGGDLLDTVDEVTFSGAETKYVGFSQRSSVTHVVMGATLTLTSADPNAYENCGMMSRVIENRSNQAETFLEVGVDSDGDIYAFDQYGTTEDSSTLTFVSVPDLNDSVALVYIADGQTMDVYVDGQLALDNVLVQARDGHFGLIYIGQSANSSCVFNNVWAYAMDSNCTLTVDENRDTFFNPEETELAMGEMTADTPYASNAYYLDADLNDWWRLTDDSRWIRGDDVTLDGACSTVDFVEDLATIN